MFEVLGKKSVSRSRKAPIYQKIFCKKFYDACFTAPSSEGAIFFTCILVNKFTAILNVFVDKMLPFAEWVYYYY